MRRYKILNYQINGVVPLSYAQVIEGHVTVPANRYCRHICLHLSLPDAQDHQDVFRTLLGLQMVGGLYS